MAAHAVAKPLGSNETHARPHFRRARIQNTCLCFELLIDGASLAAAGSLRVSSSAAWTEALSVEAVQVPPWYTSMSRVGKVCLPIALCGRIVAEALKRARRTELALADVETHDPAAAGDCRLRHRTAQAACRLVADRKLMPRMTLPAGVLTDAEERSRAD